jgi:hypothetical protein
MTLDHPLYHEAATVVTMPHGDEGLADGTRPGREVVSGKLPDETNIRHGLFSYEEAIHVTMKLT